MKTMMTAAAVFCALAAPTFADQVKKPIVVSTQSLVLGGGVGSLPAVVPIAVGVIGAVAFSITGSSGTHGANVD